jgi:hypothetical protein
MAWTAPRDWSDNSDVPDGIVTAAMLNVDVRENLGILSAHAHTGAAGQGASSMSGLTLTALVNLTFNDAGAPDAAGELQRHGNDLKWYGSSVVNLTAADASAGTASLRSLGTTSVKAAAGDHTHEVEEVDTPLAYVSGRGTYGAELWMGPNENVGTTETLLGAAQSPTFSGSDVGRAVSAFWVGGHNDQDEAFDYTLRLYINSVLKVERTVNLAVAGGGTQVMWAYAIGIEYTEEEATSGQAVELKIIREHVGGVVQQHRTMGFGIFNTFLRAQ